MLALIPVLSMFVTKGLVASIGNMASSMMYIPQTAAVHASEQSVKGNYSLGSTNIDTHSFDNVSAHKHDDNYSWASGMQSFALASGSQFRESAAGNHLLDATPAVSNLGGAVNINWGKAVGTRLDQSETKAEKAVETAAKEYIESTSSGMTKMLGYDSQYSQGTSAYDAINKGLSIDQREAFDNVRSTVGKIAKNNEISSEDALRMTMAMKAGVSGFGVGANFEGQGYTTSQLRKAWNEAQETSKDEKFSESLNQLENFGKNRSTQTQESESQSSIDSMKADFSKSSSASSRHSEAMENLHSIQQAKSNYKTNSRSIDLNLNNKFINWGMAKFGAETFENMALNKPIQLQENAQKFLEAEMKNSMNNYSLGSVRQQSYSLTQDDLQRIENKEFENRNELNVASGGSLQSAAQNSQVLKSKYKKGTAYTTSILKPLDMQKGAYNFAHSYKEGYIVKFYNNYKSIGIKKGDSLEVKGINALSNTLIFRKGIRNIRFQLRKNVDYTSKLEVFEKGNLNIQQGIRLKFTKNDQNLINSETAIVEKLDIQKKSVSLKLEDNSISNIPLSNLKHIDYGYCTTVHSSQGKTTARLIAAICEHKLLNNQKSWLVSISRHKNDLHIYTNDKQEMQKQITCNKGEEKSASDIVQAIKILQKA